MRSQLFLLLGVFILFGCSSPKSYYAFKYVQDSEKSYQANTETEPLSTNFIKPVGPIVDNSTNFDEPLFVSNSNITKLESVNELAKEANSRFNSKVNNQRSKTIATPLADIKSALEVKREVKKLQKKYKKSALDEEKREGGKSQVVALILAIIIGGLGIHRFYLGYTTIGIIQLLTAGGCGIWALIDIIRIATGDLKPAGGDYDETF